MARPGKILRGSLILFGVLFVPFATMLLLGHRWAQAVVLFGVSAWFLKLGFTKREDSWMALIDDLDD
jgi:hypothetical protein